MSQYSDRTMQRRVTVGLGILLAVAMGASLILPLLQNVAVQSQIEAEQPTPLPTATLPPPLTDFSGISFDTTYLHPSGMFTTTIPSGWEVGNSTTAVNEDVITFRNPDQLSVIEQRLIQPVEPVESLEDVSEIFTDAWLGSSWREYSTWSESTRSIRDDQVVIDFTLSRTGQDYVARQVGRTDGRYVYVTRAVFPENSPEAVRFIVENMDPALEVVPIYVGLPLDWGSYFDPELKHIIRYPSDWRVEDAAPGLPASISGPGGEMLRVEGVDAAIDSEEAAAELVTGLRSGIEVTSTTTFDRNGVSGYAIAYQEPTLEGPAQSGYAIMFDDETGRWHLADLRLPESGVNLNDIDTAANYPDIFTMMETFNRLPDVNITQS